MGSRYTDARYKTGYAGQPARCIDCKYYIAVVHGCVNDGDTSQPGKKLPCNAYEKKG